MKKFLCFAILICFVGCTQKTNIKPVTRNITFTAEMTYYNEYYEMEVDINDSGDVTAAFSYPEELKGLKFSIKDGKTVAEFSGIKIEADDSYKTAAVNFVYAAFKPKNQEVYENKDYFFVKGKCDGGEYRMYLSGAGLPLKIVDSADRFEIIIKNLKINKEKEP